MQVEIVLYGAARVVIGQSQIGLTFDSLSITLGEVLEKLITLYPRARPYLLDESGMLPTYIRILINEVRPDPDATLATLLHDRDRVTLLVAVAGGTSSARTVEKLSTIDSITNLEVSKLVPSRECDLYVTFSACAETSM